MGLERSIGKAIIEHFAPTGMSSNKIIKLAQSEGGGYARSEMLEDIRVAGQRFKNQFWVESMKTNEVVPEGLMVDKDLGYDAKYRVYGNYTYYDEESDDYFEETRSFYTDDLKAKGNWTDDFTDAFEETYLAEGQEFIGFNVTAVEHNRGYGF